MKTNEKTLKNNTTLKLCETAIMLAIATVLAEFSVIEFTFGGSVTVFSQVPIIVIAYRYGTSWGLVSGFVMGLIQMIFGLKNFSYVHGIGSYIVLIFSDYLVAFGVLGLGGIFKNKLKKQTSELVLGSILVSVLRYFSHFISGVTIWKDYAPSRAVGAIIKYSLGYNATYMGPELLVTVIGIVVLSKMFDFTRVDLKKGKKSKISKEEIKKEKLENVFEEN